MKQVALGYERSLAKGMYTLSLETYYRKTNHIVDFVDNANIFLNNQIETQLTTGYSKAYGAEFYISKNSGRLTGWISYTFSRAPLNLSWCIMRKHLSFLLLLANIQSNLMESVAIRNVSLSRHMSDFST